MLARLHGGRDHLGAEARRREKHDQVHVVEGQDLLVGVEPEEDALGLDLDLTRDLRAQLLEGGVDLVLEEIGDRDELHAGRRFQAIDGVGRAALAAADDRHADGVRAGGENAARRNGETHARRRYRLPEFPPRDRATRTCRHADLLANPQSRDASPTRQWAL